MEQYLLSHRVRPTANRLLVARALADAPAPMSLSALESRLAPMDKSSIFRALGVLLSAHVLHSIDDGSGMLKYELCRGDHAAEHAEEAAHVMCQHAHFHCQKCGATLCLHDVQAPLPTLPEGYRLTSVNFVLQGVCPQCAK